MVGSLPTAFLLNEILEIPSALATVAFFAKVKSPCHFKIAEQVQVMTVASTIFLKPQDSVAKDAHKWACYKYDEFSS